MWYERQEKNIIYLFINKISNTGDHQGICVFWWLVEIILLKNVVDNIQIKDELNKCCLI